MSDSSKDDAKKGKPVEEALKLYADARVFRDPNRIAYVRTPVGDTMAIQGEEFEVELKARLYQHNDGMILTKQDFHTVRGILTARAYANRAVQEVHLRVAGSNGAVYVDLANPAREVVVANRNGWEVCKGVQIPFRRPGRMATLKTPRRGWEGWTLRDYLAYLFPQLVELALLAIAVFLVAALCPGGPFPLLQFLGLKGAAKSTTARMIKALIDPYTDDERGFPRNEQDFSIYAHNCWLPLFGNISNMPQWLSDALCRLSTGGTFGARKLYTNDEESVITLKRPAILTGIEDVIERSDLKDRILLVELPEIDDSARMTEADLWARFREVARYILAALLDCLCAGLANLDTVRPERLHRLADFHKFMIAAFPAMGFEGGLLDQVLNDNREDAAETVLEGSWVARSVIELMKTRGEYAANATQLFDDLRRLAGIALQFDLRCWPRNPQVLSGELRRLVSDLRHHGIRVEFPPRTGKRRLIVIRRESGDACDAVKTSASPSAS